MSRVQNIAISKIQTNPLQPRKYFDEDSLNELTQSIRVNGLIQPIVVRPIEGGYSLIAGERRLKAFQKLNQETIPALIIEVGENQAENFSLIENIQRMDLTPIEEAQAFQTLLISQKITQEELAKQIGKSQSAIANKLRLLQLAPDVREALASKKITERHGRSLLGLTPEKQESFLKRIIKQDLNVAQTEKLVALEKPQNKNKPGGKVRGYATQIQLGINTINEAVAMVAKFGINISCEEQDDEDEYRMIIKFKK